MEDDVQKETFHKKMRRGKEPPAAGGRYYDSSRANHHDGQHHKHTVHFHPYHSTGKTHVAKPTAAPMVVEVKPTFDPRVKCMKCRHTGEMLKCLGCSATRHRTCCIDEKGHQLLLCGSSYLCESCYGIHLELTPDNFNILIENRNAISEDEKFTHIDKFRMAFSNLDNIYLECPLCKKDVQYQSLMGHFSFQYTLDYLKGEGFSHTTPLFIDGKGLNTNMIKSNYFLVVGVEKESFETLVTSEYRHFTQKHFTKSQGKTKITLIGYGSLDHSFLVACTLRTTVINGVHPMIFSFKPGRTLEIESPQNNVQSIESQLQEIRRGLFSVENHDIRDGLSVISMQSESDCILTVWNLHKAYRNSYNMKIEFYDNLKRFQTLKLKQNMCLVENIPMSRVNVTDIWQGLRVLADQKGFDLDLVVSEWELADSGILISFMDNVCCEAFQVAFDDLEITVDQKSYHLRLCSAYSK